MSEVTLSRRLTHYIALLGLMFFFVSCVCDRKGPVVAPSDGRYAACRQGVRNPNAPVACVDVGTLTVSPDPVEAFDHDSHDEKKPVQIVWIASDGRSDLRIEDTAGCLEKMYCNRTGMCRAQTVDVSARKDCKYTVRIGERRNDPVVITVPCCMLMDTEVLVP